MAITVEGHAGMTKLTYREWDFLVRLDCGEKLRAADRTEDRIRQKMRRAGYAEVVMSPRRWRLTRAGADAIFRVES